MYPLPFSVPPLPPQGHLRPFPCLPVASPIYYCLLYPFLLYSIISFTFSLYLRMLLIALAFILPYLSTTQTTVLLLAVVLPIVLYYWGILPIFYRLYPWGTYPTSLVSLS